MLRRLHASQLAAGAAMAATAAHRMPVCATGATSSPASSSLVMLASVSAMTTTTINALHMPRRTFLDTVFGRSVSQVKLDDIAYDKTKTRYSGTIFGFSADNVVFYSKVMGGVVATLVVFYIFFKGYVLLSRFSLQTVARLGFMSGFVACLLCYTTAISLVRRYRINATTVYNQSIALVMHNEKVMQHLGSHPRTGEFRAYNEAGGFKLPLLRRIRSGSYELSDLLGLKQRRLQMIFLLKNPASGKEGLVSCDVRKENTGFMSSTNVYRSLSITLFSENKGVEPETIILVGKPEDIVCHSLILR